VKGNGIVSALKRKFRASTDRALAGKIGITVQGIQNWKNRQKITERQLASLVHTAVLAGARGLQASAIRPLVEFFPIARSESKHGANYSLFGVNSINGRRHQYSQRLRDEPEAHFGVYLFFDSRGQAIYAGKARKQNLWKEMNLAFNRERGELQKR